LPVVVGNVFSFNSFEEILNSPAALAVQQDVSNHQFSKCDVTKCGIMIRDDLQPEDMYSIILDIDNSCNLVCPSCRSEKILITEGPRFKRQQQLANHVQMLINNCDKQMKLSLLPGGEPFVSALTRDIIKNYKHRDNISIQLQTNGLLLKKQLMKNLVFFNDIYLLQISLDAGNKATYERVRPPGKWEDIIENLDFVKEVADLTTQIVSLNFILQRNNIDSLPEFVTICNNYGFRGEISRISDWGITNFHEYDVLNVNHAYYQKALDIVSDSIDNYDKNNLMTVLF